MIAKKVFDKCVNNGLTVAFAESMTGGSLAYEMIKNPGSSQVIKGSIIAYSIEQKINLLHLSEAEIIRHSVVSEHVASAMALSIRKLMKSDIGVAVTGNAGPDKQDSTSSLEAWIAIDFRGKMSTYRLGFNDLSRIEAIRKTIQFTYEKLNTCL